MTANDIITLLSISVLDEPLLPEKMSSNALKNLEHTNLIAMHAGCKAYEITERGKAFIEGLLNLPLPKKYWKIPSNIKE